MSGAMKGIRRLNKFVRPRWPYDMPSVRAEKYIQLAHKRKQKFFYFGCSLVRRFYCKKVNKNKNYFHERDGRTDRQTECDAICGPLLGRRAA